MSPGSGAAKAITNPCVAKENLQRHHHCHQSNRHVHPHYCHQRNHHQLNEYFYQSFHKVEVVRQENIFLVIIKNLVIYVIIVTWDMIDMTQNFSFPYYSCWDENPWWWAWNTGLVKKKVACYAMLHLVGPSLGTIKAGSWLFTVTGNGATSKGRGNWAITNQSTTWPIFNPLFHSAFQAEM